MSKSREWVKYIARDEDGTLWGFANDPAKNENGWSDNGNYMLIKETDDTYDYVKWSDNIAARVDQSLKEPTPVKTISDENLLNESTGFHRLENEIDRPTKETVNHPAHYQGNKFEVIDIIEDYDLNFNLGNIIKYVLRSGKKDNRVEDLRKAQFYINRELERDSNG